MMIRAGRCLAIRTPVPLPGKQRHVIAINVDNWGRYHFGNIGAYREERISCKREVVKPI